MTPALSCSVTKQIHAHQSPGAWKDAILFSLGNLCRCQPHREELGRYFPAPRLLHPHSVQGNECFRLDRAAVQGGFAGGVRDAQKQHLANLSFALELSFPTMEPYTNPLVKKGKHIPSSPCCLCSIWEQIDTPRQRAPLIQPRHCLTLGSLRNNREKPLPPARGSAHTEASLCSMDMPGPSGCCGWEGDSPGVYGAAAPGALGAAACSEAAAVNLCSLLQPPRRASAAGFQRELL